MRDEAVVWDRFSEIYDTFMRRDMPAYRTIIEKVSRLVKPESAVLEVATGTGILALGIAGYIKQIDAVDLSRKMILKAKKKARDLGITNVRFLVRNAYSLGYENGSFDLVIVSNTLHIMPQPEKALAEIKRVMKPDGLLIAPTFAHAGSRKAVLFSPLASVAGFRAYQKWTQESFCRFLMKNGFDIVETELLSASFPLVYCCCKPAGAKH